MWPVWAELYCLLYFLPLLLQLAVYWATGYEFFRPHTSKCSAVSNLLKSNWMRKFRLSVFKEYLIGRGQINTTCIFLAFNSLRFKKGWGCSKATEHVLVMHEAMGSIPRAHIGSFSCYLQVRNVTENLLAWALCRLKKPCTLTSCWDSWNTCLRRKSLPSDLIFFFVNIISSV